MPKGKRNVSEFNDYTERLIPIRVTITRQRGNITFAFDIDGYRGAETGQIYYKGRDALEVENFLDANSVIRGQMLGNLGLVLNFATPQAMIAPGPISTGSAISFPEIVRILPGTQYTA